MQITYGQEEVDRCVQELSARLEPGSIVTLTGPLGAGKTTLVKTLLAQLGVQGEVTSPTYAYVNMYRVDPGSGSGVTASSEQFVMPGLLCPPKSQSAKTEIQYPFRIHHFDLYRITSQDEFCQHGFDEYLQDEDAIVIIEWPQVIAPLLATLDSRVVAATISYLPDDMEKRVLRV